MLINILAIVWLLLILVWALYQIRQFWKFSQKDNVGLVTTNLNNVKNILDQIIKEQLNQQNQDKLDTTYFIELGSGRGVISEFIAKNYLLKKVIAIENDWFIHTWTSIIYLIKVKLFNLKPLTDIQHINQSIFDFNYEVLKGKKIFYCYLFPQLLDKLYAQGVFKDSTVISLSFEISDLKPNQVFEIPQGFLQKKLFVYDCIDLS
jgi:hypothetical protein